MSLLFDTFGRQASAVNRRVRSLLGAPPSATTAGGGGPRGGARSGASGDGAGSVWERVAAFPYAERPADEGYVHLTRALTPLVPAPSYFLYRVEGEVLVLEHAELVFERDPAWKAALTEDAPPDVLRRPDLRVPRRAEHADLGPLRTWAGDVLSIPLFAGDDDLAGVVFCAPLGAAPSLPPPEAARAYSRAAGAALRTIHRVTALREHLRGLEAEADARRRMLGSALEARRFVALLLDLALTGTGSEAGFVAIADPEAAGLTIEASQNIPEAFLGDVDLRPGGLFTWAADAPDELLLEDFDFVAAHGVRSILAVPLAQGEALIGVFALLNFEGRATFADFSLTLLKTFAEQIRLVLGSGRLIEAFTERYLATVHALAEAYDVRSPYTHGHAERVAGLAAALGAALGLGDDALDDLRLAGRIHDVGMCGIVTADGFQADFEHPTIGAGMIEMLPVSPDVVEAVRTHHEWVNGWGFPGGLDGAAIPLSGRILALAEYVVEAAAGNPVRAPLDADALAAEVRERRGVQFDAAVADAYLALPVSVRDGR